MTMTQGSPGRPIRSVVASDFCSGGMSAVLRGVAKSLASACGASVSTIGTVDKPKSRHPVILYPLYRCDTKGENLRKRMVGLVRTGGRVSRRVVSQILSSVGALLVCVNGLAAQQSVPQQNQSRRIPERSEISKASLQGAVRDDEGRAVPEVLLTIRSWSDGTSYE